MPRTSRFQSLLHQGISLLLPLGTFLIGLGIRFNPFFIRASVYCARVRLRRVRRRNAVSIPSSSGHQFTVRRRVGLRSHPETVSIPSSSGHQFTGPPCAWPRTAPSWVSIPSSSGHQFTVNEYSPQFQQMGFKFQSLLHQGISLLRQNILAKGASMDNVSIPSSSGHQFTVFIVVIFKFSGKPCFNPFFIRASVY